MTYEVSAKDDRRKQGTPSRDVRIKVKGEKELGGGGGGVLK